MGVFSDMHSCLIKILFSYMTAFCLRKICLVVFCHLHVLIVSRVLLCILKLMLSVPKKYNAVLAYIAPSSVLRWVLVRMQTKQAELAT